MTSYNHKKNRRKNRFRMRSMALVIPAHNEEMVIDATINSAIAALAILFLNDLVIFLGVTMWVSGKQRRANVLGAFPLFYVLRFVNLYVFVVSWYEIVVRRQFRSAMPGWSTAGRRYRIVTVAAS